MQRWRAILWVVAVIGACLPAGCQKQPTADERPTLRIFLADSLARPLADVKRTFEQENPGVEVVQIPSGSMLAIRKITEAGDQADLIAVADAGAIEQFMRPRYAEWSIAFAGNELVIAYTPASRGAAGLTSANWFEVLCRDDVRTAAANPHHDPCGAWTMLCWQLADAHYASARGAAISERMARKCGAPADRRSDAEELISLLESAGGIDYAFVYRSQALQHHLAFLRLPPEINLGDPARRAAYRRAVISLPQALEGKTVEKRGDAIVYAAAIPTNARHPDLAAKYLALLLSPRGRAILAENYLTPMDPPWTSDPEKVPAALRRLVASRPAESGGAHGD